ncbi:MAG: trypsin-like peptidase domain-containing protein [Ignavibacteriaceae bacterium]|nr:trypsin-like peptidase domain-containing protein [Ignavibacteriaceae bacterium]
MLSKRRIILLAIILLIFSGSLFYIIEKRDSNIDRKDSLYHETNNPAAEYQLKNDEISNSRRNIITETVKKVSPAIVGINVTQVVQVDPFGNMFNNDPFFKQFFGNQQYNQKVKSLGSGYIISSDGYIVTNDHVAGNASEITVTMTDGEQVPAKLIGSDQSSDICLLKINKTDLPYVTFGNSDDVIIGEWVIALGNPFGLFEVNDKPTVTVGVVSSTGLNLGSIDNRFYLNMIQTDAAINGGNSGGPLVNSIGEVIGMNTIIYTAGGVQGNIGLGFAIPINKVKRIITELKDNGKISRDFNIGMGIQNIDEGIAKYYNLKTAKGVIITQIVPNSPASKAGLKVGDIITKVNKYSISDDQMIKGVFQEFRTGQTVDISILRDNEPLTEKMKLEKD